MHPCEGLGPTEVHTPTNFRLAAWCRAYLALGGCGLSIEDQAVLRFLLHMLCLRELQAQDPGAR